jgi:flagellar hook assembly protein FlgD
MRRWLIFIIVCATAPALLAGPALRVRYYSSGSQATLYWSAVSGTASYSVERTSSYPSWTTQASVGSAVSSWSQNGLAANSTYLYRIVPRDAAGNVVGTASNAAVVNTYAYTDNPLDSDDAMALQYMTELRAAVTLICAAAGAGVPVWTNALTPTSDVADEDIADLRSGLNAAYVNVGLPAPSYVDPILTGALIRHVHLQQLRDLTRTYPEFAVWLSANVSEPYFSPNADGMKESTTFSASVGFASGGQRGDFRWRVDVRSQATNAVVRSASGSGAAVAFVWDGKSNAGAVQPDGVYGLELVDVDSLPITLTTAYTTLDVTSPAAAISSPADGTVVSNIRMASGSVAVAGSVNDAVALQQWMLEWSGTAQPAVTISSGTQNTTTTSLGTWQTMSGVPNGSYTLRLTATDKAGNTTIDNVPITVGHFSASRSASQANAATSQTVTYTSVVPYPVNLRIDIWRGSTLARTLVDGPRVAGTYANVWDDLAAMGDGVYRYIATVTDGGYSLVWDKSTSYPAGPATNQFEYPKCWTSTSWVKCGETPAAFDFDPFAGRPLRIAYCVGGGEPDGTCTGSDPALVVAKVSALTETSDACDAGCILNEYQPAGRQELSWYGFATNGTYVADQPRLTVIRKYASIADNMTLVYGTAPKITGVSYSPGMFNPASVPAPVAGHTFTIAVARYDNRSVSATGYFRNLTSGALLRTITTSAQSSGDLSLVWDGRADDPANTLAASGLYEVTIVVADSTGSSATVRPIIVVRY